MGKLVKLCVIFIKLGLVVILRKVVLFKVVVLIVVVILFWLKLVKLLIILRVWLFFNVVCNLDLVVIEFNFLIDNFFYIIVLWIYGIMIS